ncbi:MAG: primosomal protein N' [Desulfobacterales bacterium]|nr:primosomal protein N' [Desulfobacterales bacterium]MCP4162622.1 primosomal protein N' [Deltaproteobacteria bacterium]
MVEKKIYIEVAVALPLFQHFTYLVPPPFHKETEIGKRVLVPFGKRTLTGYIINIYDSSNGLDNIKEIIDILDDSPLFPESMIKVFKWLSEYYIFPLGEVIKCALPGGINITDRSFLKLSKSGLRVLEGFGDSKEGQILKKIQKNGLKKNIINSLDFKVTESDIRKLKRLEYIVEEKKVKSAISKKKTSRYIKPVNSKKSLSDLTPKRSEIVEYLRESGEISVTQLKEIFPTINSFIKPLEEKEFVEIFQKEVYRDPFGEKIVQDSAKDLTDEQEVVVDEVVNSLGKGFKSYLLAGVTGSGKTEVYLQIAEKALNEGFDVIVLVPEISLISQTERRFRARFGDNVAVLHSGLSHGEKYDQWRKIINKMVSISIGVRSSIFAPFENTGLIIVDEEHDQSYKQDSTLRYNARDLALVRGKISDCPVLLGSATPSIQSSFNVINNKFTELTLSKRVNDMPLPLISVVDLKKHRDAKGIRKYVTPELINAIGKTLEKKEQIMLFINRRGFSTYPVCADCGETIKCLDCETSLTLHKNVNAYKCHLCGYSKASASGCSKCGSDKIKLLGIGTEKIEDLMVSMFPNARVARLDHDTIRGKNSIVKILKKMRNHEIDILVGTQMIAKGHDFPMITLVGILCADMSLNFPDFRSSERTFQLIAQVAGRAGRGTVEGQVVLQTYNPEHFSIESAKKQNFKEFLSKELYFRKSLQFPPFTRMIQIKISGKDLKKTRSVAEDIGVWCKELVHSHRKHKIDIMGPAEAPLSKIAGRFRWQLLLKCSNTGYLNHFVKCLKNGYFGKVNKVIRVTIDVDPFSMM